MDRPTEEKAASNTSRSEDTPRHVLVVGAMGVGKTATGPSLARRLGWGFVDSDEELMASHGRTGAEIAGDEGVTGLHAVELEMFRRMLTRAEPCVIAPAASVVDRAAGRRMMGGHTVVWLDVSSAVAARRRSSGGHRRPIDEVEQARRDATRHRFWEALADVKVDTTVGVEEVVDEIVAVLDEKGLI